MMKNAIPIPMNLLRRFVLAVQRYNRATLVSLVHLVTINRTGLRVRLCLSSSKSMRFMTVSIECVLRALPD